MEQVIGHWKRLALRQRVILALAGLAVVASVIAIMRLATETPMALLYSGLDPVAAGEVLESLEARGVPVELRDQGIYVPRAERDRLRLSLAADGLPAAGAAGYELLDSLSGFGTTAQMFDAAYWRAKEGELARTIAAGTGIRAARVHLANPQPRPFQREVAASAAVTVTMGRGTLDERRARAIRYLVSSAVAGLAPDQVAVLDADAGVILAAGEAEPSAAGLGNRDPDARAELLRRNVERILAARVGPDRAIVEVAIEADLDRQTVTERILDPDSRVAISSDTEERTETAQGTDAAGVTVASNLPDGDAADGAATSSRSSSETRERFNFEVSETVRERIVQPGQTKRITVAVLVDGITRPDPTGEPVWEPRPAAELAALRALIEAAIGFDAGRGDVVTIESLEFSPLGQPGSLVEAPEDGFLARHGTLLTQALILGAIALALILFVLRPLLQRQPIPAAPDARAPAPDAVPPSALAAPVGSDAGAPAALPDRIDRLRALIRDRSEDSAQVLRHWIETPTDRSEARP